MRKFGLKLLRYGNYNYIDKDYWYYIPGNEDVLHGRIIGFYESYQLINKYKKFEVNCPLKAKKLFNRLSEFYHRGNIIFSIEEIIE